MSNDLNIIDDFEDHGERLLSLWQVLRLTSLSRATLYREIKEFRFPEPVRLVPGGRVAWRKSDVDEWLASPLEWRERAF